MILLARHGETVWNAAGRKQGRLDSPLTPRGESQARALGALIALHQGAGRRLASFHASPLGRARSTTSIALEVASPEGPTVQPKFDPLLSDSHLGHWQGKSDAEIEQCYPGQLAARNLNKWLYRIPGGGEAYADAAARCRRFLHSWESSTISSPEDNGSGNRSPSPSHNDDLHVIVTHEITSRVLRGILLDLPIARVVELDHSQEVIYLVNERCALEQPLAQSQVPPQIGCAVTRPDPVPPR